MNLQKWWTEAGLGMMIHFGPYAVYGGEYKGQKCKNVSEWIQSEMRIPISEYTEAAKAFNPINFNADEWIKTAAEAGVKYIVFTTKHHDGFCNFKTDFSDYSMWNYQGKDLVAELRDACKKYGVHLGLYYSHCMDWHEKHGGGVSAGKEPATFMSISNDWDFPDKSDWNFKEYMEGKSLPQIKELVANYSPDLFWFDGGWDVNKEDARKFYRAVKDIKPDCMTSPRLGVDADEFADFRGFGDNAVAGIPTEDTSECIITLNESWGYKKHDHMWKSPNFVIENLLKCASVNSNLSINVGPKPDGSWPKETVDIFKGLAEWNKVNGEAVHCVDPVFAPINCEEYVFTRKGNDLYLCFLKDVRDVELVHILSDIKNIEVLGNKYCIKVSQEKEASTGLNIKKIKCDGDTYLSVIKISFDEDIKFLQDVIEQNHSIVLKPFEGKLVAKVTENRINNQGIVVDWTDTEDYLTWDFIVREPGKYKATLYTSAVVFSAEWKGGHKVFMTVNGEKQPVYEVVNDGDVPEAGVVWRQAITKVGEVSFDKAGKNTLSVKAEYIKPDTPGFGLVKILLEKS